MLAGKHMSREEALLILNIEETVPEGSTIHVKTVTSNSGTVYVSEYEW